MSPQIHLKRGKEKAVVQHHPWVFSGAIARVDDAQDGDTVDILDAAGHWLARGSYNSRSQIAARIWTWDPATSVDRAFLRNRLLQALTRREAMIQRERTNAFRVVNAESDLMPGLVVDQYAGFAILQFLTLGIDRWKQELTELVQELLRPHGIYERSDVDVREKEGLAPAAGLLAGLEPPDEFEIRENGLRFLVGVKSGHKTGFYLDQRENRARVARHLTDVECGGCDILNAFSYTGGFAVYLCAANPLARVVNLDSSADALNLARENMRLNGSEDRGGFVEGDAFQVLRRLRDEGRTFDGIILDPPKFVYSRAQMPSGLRGYKDINLLALKLLKPGGTLVTFSCSGLVSADLFQKVVFGAAVDAGREAQIVGKLLQSSDHPILLSFPESEYLKGLICRVV